MLFCSNERVALTCEEVLVILMYSAILDDTFSEGGRYKVRQSC